MEAEHRCMHHRISGIDDPFFSSYQTPNKLYRVLVYLRYDKNDNLIVKGTVRKRKKGLTEPIGYISTAPKHKDNGGDPLQQPMIVTYTTQPPYYVRYATGQMYELMYNKI